jgi:hypothetical protein
MPNSLLLCKGIYDGFFGSVFTFAAKSLQHSANQLQQWAREQDLGVKSFANSLLSTSQSLCPSCQGMLLFERARNLQEGFVFFANSCSGLSSNTWHCYNFCSSETNTAINDKEFIEPIVECVRKQALIINITRDLDLAELMICKIRDENRNLHHQLACVVLFEAIEKD